jgi:hypothetical protein
VSNPPHRQGLSLVAGVYLLLFPRTGLAKTKSNPVGAALSAAKRRAPPHKVKLC